jgi:hypothetical protein
MGTILQTFLNLVGIVSAATLGAIIGVMGLIEYVREDGFDPLAWKLSPHSRKLVINTAMVGAALLLVGFVNKAFLYLGAAALEASAIFWFMNRVPTQPPKIK